MALELHFKKPFRKWSFKTYVYKQKTLQKIQDKGTETKQVVLGFGNWGNHHDSIK
jgi:hypothetical protein